jgi:hypothetical protein
MMPRNRNRFSKALSRLYPLQAGLGDESSVDLCPVSEDYMYSTSRMVRREKYDLA